MCKYCYHNFNLIQYLLEYLEFTVYVSDHDQIGWLLVYLDRYNYVFLTFV